MGEAPAIPSRVNWRPGISLGPAVERKRSALVAGHTWWVSCAGEAYV